MFTLRLNEKSEALRRDFQNWLKSNPPPEITGRLELDEFVELSRAWQRTLAKERWVAVHWPEQYGGRGLSSVEEAVVQECLAQARAVQLVNMFGLSVAGPLLLSFGTASQRARFLPKILNADELWCQGFSEPDAGTDLASLKTAAHCGSDGWLIHGEKTWISFAQYAAWCLCLARSDHSAPKHDGLTCFAVPLKANGVCVEPMPLMSEDQDFSKVLFDHVQINDECRIGHPGQGWEIALRAIGFRQSVEIFAHYLQSETVLVEIGESLRDFPNNSSVMEEYGRLAARHIAARTLALAHSLGCDENKAGFEGALDRLAWSGTYQDICRFSLELHGLAGVIDGGPCAKRGGIVPQRYLQSRGASIASGTSEIYRNIVAEKILGLPRGT